MRILAGFTTLAFLLNLAFFPVLAQEGDRAQEEMIATEINSFELFWPIVAGRTRGDPLYFLKTLKEAVRGWFIFGSAQKADYAVFLATKRVVEAEKLIQEGRGDLADETLDAAVIQLELAESNVSATVQKRESLGASRQNMVNRLSNLAKFLPFLSRQTKDGKDRIERVISNVDSLSSKLQGR